MALIIFPDPCPHVTQLGLLAARVHGTDEEVELLEDHLSWCEERRNVEDNR